MNNFILEKLQPTVLHRMWTKRSPVINMTVNINTFWRMSCWNKFLESYHLFVLYALLNIFYWTSSVAYIRKYLKSRTRQAEWIYQHHKKSHQKCDLNIFNIKSGNTNSKVLCRFQYCHTCVLVILWKRLSIELSIVINIYVVTTPPWVFHCSFKYIKAPCTDEHVFLTGLFSCVYDKSFFRNNFSLTSFMSVHVADKWEYFMYISAGIYSVHIWLTFKASSLSSKQNLSRGNCPGKITRLYGA